MDTADQHATALAIVHEEAGRTLSKDDFDLCMRIAKRALAPSAKTRHYQIGAPGIAGHQIVWWDVPQDEYERQKAAGFMKTGIVYREASCS